MDPLQAVKDSVLSGGLKVKAILGSGSMARVLWVKREEQQSFAQSAPLGMIAMKHCLWCRFSWEDHQSDA